MPPMQRPPDPMTSDATRPREGVVTLHGSFEVLLPSGDRWTRAADTREISQAGSGSLIPTADSLSELASFVEAFGAVPKRRPSRWAAPAFAREVERVRSQLRPIRTPDALTASFAREASFVGPSMTATSIGAAAVASSPIATAYALRWLEIVDGRARPGWCAWLAGYHSIPVQPSHG